MILRRLVTVPTVVLLEIAIVATAPLSLAIGLVASIALRSSRPWRTVALVVSYAVIELSALLRVARGIDDWDELMRSILRAAYVVFDRVLDVQVEVEEGSVSAEELHQARGVIVLARHCGPGDSLFIAWLLAVQLKMRLHIVLKKLLRVEPAVDIAGDHLGLCFVARGRRSREGVAAVASSLDKGDALLLFPEGGNFSWERWQQAIRKLTARGEHLLARRARQRTHTLPPRSGGAYAALSAAPQADVVLLAHSGFGADGRDRPWWRLPVHQRLTVRTVRVAAASVPRDETGVRDFLDRAWSQVDTWVDGHAQLMALATEAKGR